MDLDATEKVISITVGMFTICTIVYAGYRGFQARVNSFVRTRLKNERKKQGKQCPRCRALQPRRTSRCQRCRFEFIPSRRSKRGRP